MASLLFPGQIVADLLTGVRVNAGSSVRILGSAGAISLATPFTPGGDGSRGIYVQRDGAAEELISVAEDHLDLYGLKAEAVAQYIAERQAPAMGWEDTLGNMRTLDQWRAALGVVYDTERAMALGALSTDHDMLERHERCG